MSNIPLLSIEVGTKGITAIRLMAYSDSIEKEAERTYRTLKDTLSEIDRVLQRADVSGRMKEKKA